MLPKVCISYSSKDSDYFQEFVKILRSLEFGGLISSWTDQKLVLGQDWNDEIQSEFKSSDIYILLLSSDFFSSSYINTIETKIALNGEENGAVILPIFLRKCDFQSHNWLAGRHGAPKGRWVSDFKSSDEKDEIYTILSQAIREAVERYISRKKSENRVYFGISNNMRLSKERKRVIYSLTRYEENSDDISFAVGPTPEEYDELLDFDEADFKKQIKDEMQSIDVLILLVDEHDDCCEWQFETLQEYAKEGALNSFMRIFFFYNDSSADSELNKRISDFVKLYPEKILHQKCDNSADITRIITDELEEYFEEQVENEDIPGEKKKVTFFFDPEDARNLLKWNIKQRLDADEDIDVITRPDARKISLTKEMLSQSNGVALYYGQANHNWFDTIQVYLRKFFVNEKRIEPRIVFIDEPDAEVKDQMFINRDLLNNNEYKEISILTDKEQAAADLEAFIQRVKSSNG